MLQGSTVIAKNPPPRTAKASGAAPFIPFGIAAGALIIAFAKVLFDLAAYSLKTEVYSHILLVPFVSAYLVWQLRQSLPSPQRERSDISTAFLCLGALILVTYFVLQFAFGMGFSSNDSLSLTILAFCCFFVGLAIQLLGRPFSKDIAFPLAFLFFLAPFPDLVTEALETGSQHASAEVYSWMMSLSGATYFRDGLTFALPGLSIKVAQECSGIRSSIVLFITSLIGGHMFLRSPARRTALALSVFPLGIIRNAFRIYVLSMLSAHWNPRVIDSPLHHKGGPIFFALSLIPFFLFLVWLRKSEQKDRSNSLIQKGPPSSP
jgi:exosortase C (VPDSG-CTERM-specific)